MQHGLSSEQYNRSGYIFWSITFRLVDFYFIALSIINLLILEQVPSLLGLKISNERQYKKKICQSRYTNF